MGRGQGSGGRAGRPLNSGGSVRKGVAPGGEVVAEKEEEAQFSGKTFGNSYEAINWVNNNYDFTDLSVTQRNAIATYTTAMYRKINTALRTGTDAGYLQGAINALDEILSSSKGRMKEDVIAWRRSGPEVLFGALESGVGTVFKDNGFVSTAMVKDAAFASYPVLWKIRIPKGKRGVPIATVSSLKSEMELLLPRGSKFKVTSIEKKGNQTHIEVDYLGG